MGIFLFNVPFLPYFPLFPPPSLLPAIFNPPPLAAPFSGGKSHLGFFPPPAIQRETAKVGGLLKENQLQPLSQPLKRTQNQSPPRNGEKTSFSIHFGEEFSLFEPSGKLEPVVWESLDEHPIFPLESRVSEETALNLIFSHRSPRRTFPGFVRNVLWINPSQSDLFSQTLRAFCFCFREGKNKP